MIIGGICSGKVVFFFPGVGLAFSAAWSRVFTYKRNNDLGLAQHRAGQYQGWDGEMAQDQFPRYGDRYFYLSPLYSRSGWYFRTRGGKAIGPFFAKQQALQAAAEFAAECRRRGESGGRRA